MQSVPSKNELAGKVILLTGATDGIGKAAALNFAKRGATLVIMGRNRQKTVETLVELRSASGNDHLDSLICDLSSLVDVQRAVTEFKTKYQRLDVLANNAGATFKQPKLSPDGYELTFALNHLSHFLLTNGLRDLLLATPGARVISTSSAMQGQGRLNLETVATNTALSGPRAYGTSKLANILFTKELQRHLGNSVAVNCFHPGSVVTRFGAFGSDQGWLINLVYALARPFSKTPEQGADTLVWLATDQEAANLHGQYLTNRRVIQPQKQALDERLAAGLWELSEKLCAKALGR